MDRKPNLALAIVGSLLPGIFSAGVSVVLVVLLGLEETLRLIQGAGPLAYSIGSAAFAVSLMIIPLIVLIGRGRQVPVFLPIALASVPWWVGLGVFHHALREVLDAVAHVNPADKLLITMAGASEALGAQVLGAGFASACLAGTSLGLAMAAAAMRPRSVSVAGLAVSAPVVGIFGVAVLAMLDSGSAHPLVFLGLPAAAFVVAAALGGYSMGEGVEGQSTAPAALAAIVAGVLAVAGGVATFASSGATDAFAAVAFVNPADRSTLLAAGISDLVTAKSAGVRALVLGGAALALGFAVAFRRARPSNAALVSVGISVAGLATMIVVDGRIVPSTLDTITSLTASSGPGAGGPTLPVLRSSTNGLPGRQSNEEFLGALLTADADGASFEGGPPVAWEALKRDTTQRADLLGYVREQLERTKSLHEMAGDLGFSAKVPIAAAASLDARTVSTLAAIAKEAGSKTLVFTATRPRDPELQEKIPREYAKLFELATPLHLSLELGVASPEALAEYSTAVVGPSGDVQVKDASGNVELTLESGEQGGGYVALSAAPGVTLERYLQVADALDARGVTVEVVPDPAVAPARDADEGAPEIADEVP